MALVKFVGSGMAVVSTGLGFTVPQSAIRNGYAMIDYLSKHKAQQTSKLLQEITADIWANWGQGQVPRSAALKQLQGLPIIFSNCCPPPNYFTDGLVGAAAAAAKGNVDIASSGRVIAAEIIMRGRETNVFEKSGLNEQLCYFLMERLFVQLLSRFELLEELKPMLQSYFLNKLWRETQSADFVAVGEITAPEKPSRDEQIARRRGGGDEASQPSAHVEVNTQFRDEIEGITEPDALRSAADRFAVSMTDAASADARTMSQLQLGRLRMRLGVQLKAAETLNEARQLLSTGLAQPLMLDKAGIRRKAQFDLAELLWELSKITGEREQAEEAARTLEPICQSLRPTGDLSVWVTSYSLLATIYQGLSRDISGTQNLEKAARNFEKAGELLSRTSQPVEWATLANKLSYALELIAVRSKDLDIMTQAAEVKRAALDVFEVHGDSKLLETLRDELYSLHDELQKMSRPETEAALVESA